MTILPLTGGSDVFRTLTRTLRDGGFVPLLAARDLSGGGIEVELLGEPARVAVGPAALAVSTGAALFPVSIRYEPLPAGRSRSRWGIVITFHDEVVPGPATGSAQRREAVRDLTQRCVDALSGAIRENPADWHMLQRVFVADLPPRTHGGAA
jgi:KDO2-lipid IV(A) lauroyltransferase